MADGFQRKRLKCEKLRQTTNDRHQVMPKAHICLWQNELKRILKCEYLHVMYSINMQGFCYNFTSTGQLSNIRQFLSDNLSLEIVLYWTVVLTIWCYQTGKWRITKWSEPKAVRGGGTPLEIFEKLDPKSCILRVSTSVQIFSKKFFYQVKQKSCKFQRN